MGTCSGRSICQEDVGSVDIDSGVLRLDKVNIRECRCQFLWHRRCGHARSRWGKNESGSVLSKVLTSAEQRYAQIEKECLANVWACEKYVRFICGLAEFKLLTYHKPLVSMYMEFDVICDW